VSDEVRDGTAVSTGVELRAELTFTDATLVRLGANTIFSFNEGTRNLELGGGAMLLRVSKDAGADRNRRGDRGDHRHHHSARGSSRLEQVHHSR
jgi:ferric-dicitrate binding protein FerR (iron transport regulator)